MININEELILIKPTYQDQEQVMSFRKEFFDLKESLHGGCGLSEYDDYHAWMEHLSRMADFNRLPEGRVVSSEYLCIRQRDQRLVGVVNIRHYLDDYLLITGGHIGYSIRPSERLKGYAHEQLRLALEKTDKLGIKQVLITCNKANEASRKTILKAGGIKENEVIEDDGNVVERYWIDRSENGGII